MREIVEELQFWTAARLRYAVATVVRTWHSAPRQPGAAMAVSEHGEVVGSVSGGCVEGAVYELAHEVMRSGKPVVQRYGVSDADAFEIGLTCGGTVEILVQPVDGDHDPDLPALLAAITAQQACAVATVLSGSCLGQQLILTPDQLHSTFETPGLAARIVPRVRGMLARAATGSVTIGCAGPYGQEAVEVFVQSFAPPPRMLIFGAVDFTTALLRVGKHLGYHVTVCDARPVFTTRERFPDADELVVRWPHDYLRDTDVDERTVLCVLTHDPKFDIPLLEHALTTPAAYIGVLGSRRTHRDRIRRLHERGTTDSQLRRLAAPIGLDLGANTPEETAIAIAAEIIALDNGGTGQRLATTEQPIHHARPVHPLPIA
ncbi:XdhC family protein [Sciscionella marina]|uniref:XdhC family protein n=1 Tax=Sciscionella marina TaxID=508770 RepID=UPI000380A2BF|nr:XdhC/CoxI family protein [Sciscionella marina]